MVRLGLNEVLGELRWKGASIRRGEKLLARYLREYERVYYYYVRECVCVYERLVNSFILLQ